MITDTIATAVQVVVPAIQGAQDVAGGPSGDPFTKSLKAFSDIRVVKFSGDEGPILAFKLIFYSQKMVFMLYFVLIEQAR